MRWTPPSIAPATSCASLVSRLGHLLAIREEITRTSQRTVTLAEGLRPWSRLLELPGFGVMVTSSYLAAIGDGLQFKRGRQVSAWLGLVPGQHGSGGKVRLHGMTKSGDRYIRTMMLHGARAAIGWGCDRDTPLARWINPMIQRRGYNKATVALANKNACIAWSIVANDAHYDPGQAFGSA